ncbi:uncharacterized protein LOC129756326 [Uranotaenia lowii]|uniref:uncharacterized protein LOC129756326 n=1 Tax=Uranotaenia lowii TaxID=190385 RepID=UPI00247A1CEB|nr:uncharacterized protein LOC129756326 [Uranotaenia lowii]
MERYKLDLSQVFSDYRKKVFLGRRKQWKRVGCLMDYLRSAFHVQHDVVLTSTDEVWFPETEELDVIRETDNLIVKLSNSSAIGTQKVSSPLKAGNFQTVEARGEAIQNGKRKRESSSDESDSGTSIPVSSDSSDENDQLVEVFSKTQNLLTPPRDKPPVDAKPKRKRIRKRKSKKKMEPVEPKIIVKTYGKSKVPPIVLNGDASKHTRFGDDNSETDELKTEKDEPYRNLNKVTNPRIIKAINEIPSRSPKHQSLPSIPDYVDLLSANLYDVADTTQLETKPTKKQKSQAQKNKNPRSMENSSKNISVEIKQELIDQSNASESHPMSPTWDTDIDKEKEAFISSYQGSEFWSHLKPELENFPIISIPSLHEIIAYQQCNDDSGHIYLSFVERATDEELTLRLLNGLSNADNTFNQIKTIALNQLTTIRLIASYH